VQQVGRASTSSDWWKKLQLSRIKCNIDASVSSSWNHNGIGICLRDEKGTYVFTGVFSKQED